MPEMKADSLEHGIIIVRAWLARHNIPADALQIKFEFPQKRHAQAAEAAVRYDHHPASGTDPFMIQGIRVQISGEDQCG